MSSVQQFQSLESQSSSICLSLQVPSVHADWQSKQQSTVTWQAGWQEVEGGSSKLRLHRRCHLMSSVCTYSVRAPSLSVSSQVGTFVPHATQSGSTRCCSRLTTLADPRAIPSTKLESPVREVGW